MTMATNSNQGTGRAGMAARPWIAAAVVVGVLMLGGCGNKKEKDPAASQTAAKVNKEEITVHQINYLLSQQRALPAQRAASAGGQVLERLIDQELAVQKAADQKIDRDPRVVQQLEVARREIIARAYLEKIGQGAPKPTPQEVKAYYEAHPALFAERRIYSFREVTIEATPEQLVAIKAKLEASKDLAEFVAYLKESSIRFALGEAVRGAEQLPLSSLDTVAKLKDGQTLFTQTPIGASVLYLVGSQKQPVDEKRATAPIEQYLLNERRRKLMEDDLKALRSSAKIEYVGNYASDRAKALAAAPPPAPEPPPLTALTPTLPPAASAAPQVEVAPTPVSAGSMPSNAILDKGLKGMK
jgi:EpsD family peptidyl-prolyl cis-trans isomerase